MLFMTIEGGWRAGLHIDLVKALGRMRTADTLPMDVVFRGLIPRMTAFRKDLEVGGLHTSMQRANTLTSIPCGRPSARC